MCKCFISQLKVARRCAFLNPFLCFGFVFFDCPLNEDFLELFWVECQVFNSSPHKTGDKLLRCCGCHAHIDVALDDALELALIGHGAISIQLKSVHNRLDQVDLNWGVAHIHEDVHCSHAEGLLFWVFEIKTVQKFEHTLKQLRADRVLVPRLQESSYNVTLILLLFEHGVQVTSDVHLELLLIVSVHLLGTVIVITALVLNDLVNLHVLVRGCHFGDLSLKE